MLCRILSSLPRLQLWRMRVLMFQATHKIFSQSTINRMCDALDYSYKKCTVRTFLHIQFYIMFGYFQIQAKESDLVLASMFFLGLERRGVNLDNLKFLDEVSVSTKNGVQLMGRAPRGERCQVEDNFVRRDRATFCGILGRRGMVCHAAKYGSFNKMDFRCFMLLVAMAHLTCGDYVIIDNARIHLDDIYIDILAYVGVTIYFLPPYSPQYNAIELVWNGMKFKMLTMRHLTSVDPIAAANLCLQDYYDCDMTSVFRQCGYDFD